MARCAALLLLVCVASAPWSARTARAGDVVVLMSAGVDAYREAQHGFESGLRGHEVVETLQMEGDVDRGRELLAKMPADRKPDLVFAVGVWALEAALDGAGGIPIVYAMVLNPTSIVGDRPANVTGASMNVSVKDNLQLLRQLGPQVRRVGLVYNDAKTGYLVKQARAQAAGVGIELLARNAANAKQAIKAVDSLLAEGIDAFWFLPDDTLLAAAVSKHVFLVSHRSGVPILGISERQAQMGALLAVTFASSEDIGRQAAELANAILAGRRASDVPSTTARQTSLTVNLKVARKLGVEIPESMRVAANELIK